MKKLLSFALIVLVSFITLGCSSNRVEPVVEKSIIATIGDVIDYTGGVAEATTGESEEVTGVVVEELTGSILKEECVISGYYVRATFTQEFEDTYQYEDSEGYMFALNVNGYYYNVFRNENGGVSNSYAEGLTGAVPAVSLKRSSGYAERYIPLNEEVKVANKNGEYGYTTTFFTRIDAVTLSPVKETDEVANIFWFTNCG